MRKLIYILLLLTPITSLKAQDVQIEGEEGEVIHLKLSGFADSERSAS